MTVGATLVASLLAILGRPSTWPLGLATFLLRGGFLLVLAPIVVLPSAVGLGNVLAPLLETVVFRGVTPAIVMLLVTVVVALVVWLVGGGLLAAAVETELVRSVAADEQAWPSSGAPLVERSALRVLTVRLIAMVPLLLALVFGAVRIVAVAYRELTVPSNVGVPLALRVIASAPDAVSIVIGTWLAGETVGGLAARRVILAGDRVVGALRAAVVRLVQHPLRCAALAVVPAVPLTLVLVLVALAGSSTWEALRAALAAGSEPLVVVVLVLALVALFGGGLLLIGVASAWRAAIWTLDVGGTFGATGYGPVGFWNDAVDSGTLSDLRPRGADSDTR